VAGWAGGLYQKQECITITIHADGLHAQNVTAGGAFVPQFTSASAEKPRFTGLLGPPQSFSVHPRYHQHFQRS
jgi:hypothetical protein